MNKLKHIGLKGQGYFCIVKQYLDESFAELRQAAGVEEIKPQVMKAARGKRK